MTIQIIEMAIEHINTALDLWSHIEGMGLSSADEPEALTRFLQQNPGLSFIAGDDGRLVGTCLCGSDGRRGYLYHLAVAPEYRQQGIGMELVESVFLALRERDIHKCHIMVFGTNELGLKFWRHTGWVTRPEIVLMSRDVKSDNSPCGC